jgi:N-methylhydantoinase A
MAFRIGVDIGGTFTDTTVLDDNGTVTISKTPSVPHAPEQGVLDGIMLGLERAGLSPAACTALVNSSTIAVNSVVQRNGAAVGLLVTEGFEDLLELGRVKMSDPFSLKAMRQSPLVAKNWVRGVKERVDAGGRIRVPLDRRRLLAAARELVAQGAEALAIIFLHSHANPAHEVAAKDMLVRKFPRLDIATSSEVWPQIREYERATVLVMNSYIAPKVGRYIRSLDTMKSEPGLACPLYISGSNGGIMPSSHATARPISTLLSGPSAGIVAAANLMRNAGIDKGITLDIGGTSADICVLETPEIPYAWGQEIEGLPVAVPYVDVSSIGAGGGSIAYADNLGVLKVGPRSAGAVPGPAAYDRGGREPTLTDAYLVTGLIHPDNFVGGRIKLNPARAGEAIGPLADTLRLGLIEAAAGIIRVTTSNLMAEFTRLMAKRGVDPRDFVLIAFGGAGPTHACLLADELHIRRIAIPVSPGTFCALGSVLSDFRLDYLKTVYAAIEKVPEQMIEGWYADISAQARNTLQEVSREIAELKVIRTADVRYLGQGFQVAIPFERMADLPDGFRAEYRKLYGPRHDDAPVEVINFRATVVGVTRKPLPRWASVEGAPSAENERKVFLGTSWQTCPVYRRHQMQPGWSATGPLLVDQADTTTLVTTGWSAKVDALGNLMLNKGSAAR